jgi:tetratricopeptide (TPR) repeat protein
VDASNNPRVESPSERWLRFALISVVVAYAFLAGLRTVGDLDSGWQLAMGRYVVQHHSVPSTDVLSYTVRDQEWIYPPFSGAALYLVFAVAGWAGLSWVCALVSSVVARLVLQRGSLIKCAIAVASVPLLADRATPRGDLFTLLLFPIFLLVLIRARQSSKPTLWPLPLLMVLWVNFHPGFVFGLALLAWYVAAEIVEGRKQRIREQAPWLIGTIAAMLVNPWGPRILVTLVRQGRAMKLYEGIVGEWSPARLTWSSIFGTSGTLQAAVVFVLVAGVCAALVSLKVRRYAECVLLVAACYGSLRYIRLQALCAVVIIVVGGRILDDLLEGMEHRGANARAGAIVRWGLSCALLLVAIFGSINLVSNRYYVMASSTSQFGAGESWWFPERAAAFIQRERLPGQLFHDYNVGGFVALRLAPEYPDYIDGRAVPFGPKIFMEQALLLREPLDSAAWTREADRRGINILMFSLARFGGLGSVDLAGFCRSQNWRPVYLDEVSILLLRNVPANRAWIDRMEVDCARHEFEVPTGSAIERFNVLSNEASIFYVLGRDREAFAALREAESIYPYDPNAPLTRGQLLQSEGHAPQAEAQYREALRRKQTDTAWTALGNVLASEGRLRESRAAFQKAAALAPHPQNAFKALGQLSLALHEPDEALKDFDRAESESPYRGGAEVLATEFLAQLDQGRAEAWRQKNDLARAIEFQQRATSRTPMAQKRWVDLANLYEAAGRHQDAEQARARALALGPVR